jgi:uncharacterized protein YuzE
MRVEYDKKADAIYIYLSNGLYAYGKNLDHERRIDYDANDEPIGIELLCVSEGVITNDLPHRGEIERLLEKHHIKLFA